jgi:hypothetical protein
VLIIGESSIGAFLLTILLQFYHYYYRALSFYPCTCWLPTISVLNLVTYPCYSNLLLRRRRWTGILQWGVLGYVLPRLPFLWSYGMFCCSVSLRVIIVFRDITYVRIILYWWHLVIFEHFWPYVWNNWSWVTHTMSTWFSHKNWVWHLLWLLNHPLRGNIAGIPTSRNPDTPEGLVSRFSVRFHRILVELLMRTSIFRLQSFFLLRYLALSHDHEHNN